ncbi:MAG TPA: hypothetical protein VMX17_10075, partial [Candidatus Glassbacteria bacterium]|nr:hypothetical protein [Candidatus Glassbacteria bacterium]
WEQAAKNDLIHRVGFPLYNIGKDTDGRPISITSQIVNIVRDPITGKHYEYRYWPGKEDEVEISLECERNLQDGTVKPWV